MAAQQVQGVRSHIVVGADGSASSRQAVVWAAHEATTRGLAVRVVHGLVSPPPPVMWGDVPYPDWAPSLREGADHLLAEGADTARAATPDLKVETSLVEANGVNALLESSQDAAMTVVGSRGLGGFRGLLLGSTAVQLAMFAQSPVVVVRDGDSVDGTRPVVVGVDASDHALAAVRFGFDAAAARSAPLHAVHAWTEPTSAEPGDMLPLVYDPREVQAEETRLLAEVLAGSAEQHPDVAAERQVVRARPSPTLRDASRNAQLLVVGARGVGGFRGLLFGSVSQAMIHHAHCPVAVVRAQS